MKQANPKTKKKTKTKNKTVIKKTVQANKIGVSIPHMDSRGKKKTPIVLSKVISEQKVNSQLLAQAVRVYRTNQRHGTQSTKTRGEVTGSTRKIYRQKGTGRARHGSVKAPVFVGGGIVFGPKPREFELRLPKKMRRKVLLGLLSDKVNHQNLTIISGFDEINGKTKEIAKLMDFLNLKDKKTLVLTVPNLPKLIKAARNLSNITLRPINSVSAIDLMDHEHLILPKEAVQVFENLYKNLN